MIGYFIYNALIYAWYLSEAGVTALDNMLFARVCLSGRPHMIFVKSIDELPPPHDYSMKRHTYPYMKEKPFLSFS